MTSKLPATSLDNGVQQGLPTAAAPSGAYANPSHLFTLRVWVEEIDNEQHEWRGRIHHVESNQTRYFREWSALLPVLLAMIRQSPNQEVAPEPPLVSNQALDSDSES